MGILLFSTKPKVAIVQVFWLEGGVEENTACFKERYLDRKTNRDLLDTLIDLLDNAPKIPRGTKYVPMVPGAKKFFLSLSDGQETEHVRIMDPVIQIWTNKLRLRCFTDEFYEFLKDLMKHQRTRRMDFGEFIEKHAVIGEPQLA